jgi:hypothetical protein
MHGVRLIVTRWCGKYASKVNGSLQVHGRDCLLWCLLDSHLTLTLTFPHFPTLSPSTTPLFLPHSSHVSSRHLLRAALYTQCPDTSQIMHTMQTVATAQQRK